MMSLRASVARCARSPEEVALAEGKFANFHFFAVLQLKHQIVKLGTDVHARVKS